MLSNNAERLQIVLRQQNRYDYEEFIRLCIAQSIVVLPLSDWISKVGMVSAAEVMFPSDPIEEAYSSFVHLRNGTLRDPRGLGDSIARITEATGLASLAELYTRLTGRDCGCKDRQEALNKLVPYGIKELTQL